MRVPLPRKIPRLRCQTHEPKHRSITSFGINMRFTRVVRGKPPHEAHELFPHPNLSFSGRDMIDVRFASRTPVRKLRISIVEYLNTAPLVWGFTEGPLAGKYDLSF